MKFGTLSQLSGVFELYMVDWLWTSVGPSGVLAPQVEVLGATSLKVSWTRPINSNGLLISYTLRLPQPRFDFNVSVTSHEIRQLNAYTLYNVTLTACSGN